MTDAYERITFRPDLTHVGNGKTGEMCRFVCEQGTKLRLAELYARKSAENEYVLAQVR